MLLSASGCDVGDSDDSHSALSMGSLTGIVADDEELPDEGESPQTYEGASVRVVQAIEAGTYRLSADSPVRVSYNPGDVVVEMTTDKQGSFFVALEAGAYFVQAFHGDRSYSGKQFVEIVEGETTEVLLGLTHGI